MTVFGSVLRSYFEEIKGFTLILTKTTPEIDTFYIISNLVLNYVQKSSTNLKNLKPKD